MFGVREDVRRQRAPTAKRLDRLKQANGKAWDLEHVRKTWKGCDFLRISGFIVNELRFPGTSEM